MTQETLTQLNNLDYSDILDEIDLDEEGYKNQYSTYLQFLESEEGDLAYYVHEYRNPDESIGYITYFKYPIDGVDYIKAIDSNEERSRDWEELTKD